MSVKDANDICFTFDSYFCEWKGRDTKTLKIKRFSLKSTV